LDKNRGKALQSVESTIIDHYLNAMGIVQWRERTAKIEVTAATSEQDWASLEQKVAQCQRCTLCHSRTQTVFGTGSHRAKLMIIGEAPGAQEDQQGKPFVGRAGQLLTQMLKSIGFTREDVYIANILKCRPPMNRDPAPEEVAECTPYLQQQIALLQPQLLLAVGRIAAHYLLGVTLPLSQLRGQRLSYGPLNTPLLVTYHPAYLLRNPKDKAKVYQDLLSVKRELYS
jgi:DNA polymerase